MTTPFASRSVPCRLYDAPTGLAHEATAGHKSSRKTKLGDKKGFTLLEVMVAATVFAMTALGIYTLLFRAYQLSAMARYRDDARAVLQTFADQFERLDVSDTNYYNSSGSIIANATSNVLAGTWTYQSSNKRLVDSGGNIIQTGVTSAVITRELYTFTTLGSTGLGLQYWDSSTGEVDPSTVSGSSFTNPPSSSPTNYLTITLGGTTSSTPGNTVSATVTRNVVEIDPTTGALDSTDATHAPGQLLSATFTIAYSVYNHPETQSLTVLRLSP